MGAAEDVIETLGTLLKAVERLEDLYPSRRFTLDGHLVGSIGEVLASELYGLELLPASSKAHDGVSRDGRHVQIKLTQSDRIGIYSEPQFLIVLGLSGAHVREVYNGPGQAAWDMAGKLQKNGQRSITTSKLASLNGTVAREDRITRVCEPSWFRTATK